MTHTCCPECRLRFTPAAAAHLPGCPQCGKPLQAAARSATLGFRLFKPEDVSQPEMPEAISASLAIPDPDHWNL